MASWLNSSASIPPPFSSLVFTGPVNTSVGGPVSLGGGTAKTATLTVVTPAGNLTVRRIVTTPGGPATVASQSGSTCYFIIDGGAGTYTVLGSKSTGKFAGAAGSGTYTETVRAAANLPPGNTACSASNLGSILAQGASITFEASGPLTLSHQGLHLGNF